MSIIIGGNTIASPNTTTKERIALNSTTESNLIILQSSLDNTNISFINGTDTNIFYIGKKIAQSCVQSLDRRYEVLPLPCESVSSRLESVRAVPVSHAVRVARNCLARTRRASRFGLIFSSSARR
jgi:hypothetical protein